MTKINASSLADEMLRFSDAALRSAQESVIAIDLEYTIKRWNEVSERIYGITANEAIGKKLLDIVEIVDFSPDENAEWIRELEAYGHYQEIQLHRTRCAEVWVSVSMQAIEDDGKCCGWVIMASDITDSKKAEIEIRKLSQAVKQSPSIVMITDIKGNIEYVNPKFTEVTGYTEQEIIGCNASILGDQSNKEQQRMWEVITTGKGWRGEFANRKKDGNIYWEAASISSIKDREGTIINFVKVAEDITSRKLGEEALSKSEAKYRSLVEYTQVGIAAIDLYGRFNFVNEALARMIGYSRDKLLGKYFIGYLHPEDVTRIERLFKESTKQIREFTNIEFKAVHRKGHIVHMYASSIPIEYEGEIIGFNSVIENITDRKKTESKILDYQKRLRSLASQLSLAEERERKRIATEMHDRLGQTLVACQMKLCELKSKKHTNGELMRGINKSCVLLDQLINEIRALTFQLSSPLLYQFGIVAALQQLTEEFQKQYGIKIKFHDDGQPKSLNMDVSILLFQMVRELILNIVKHAQAQQAMLYFQRSNEQLHITVEDDGVGFEVSEMHSDHRISKGYGLFSIQERLFHIGGQITIRSEPNHGTCIIISVPLQKDTQ
jgi:PAS domain S-box-containing protein